MLKKHINARLSALFIILSLMFSISVVSIAYARSNNNDQISSLSQQNDNVMSRLVLPTVSSAASAILVDLSDTTNFKHSRSTGKIEVSQIRFTWTTEGNATTTLKLGLVASTSSTGSLTDIYWFDEVSFSSTESGNASFFKGRQEKTLDYQPSILGLGLSGVTPTGFLTNDISTSTSMFATTTRIASPIGMNAATGGFPAVGDLVMRVFEQKGTATTTAETLYRVIETSQP